LIQPIESDLINTVITTGAAYPLDVAATRNNFINNPNNRAFAPGHTARLQSRAHLPVQFVRQQELPGLVTTVAYVGSQGRNLFLRTITNRIVSVEGPTGFVTREFDIPQGIGVRPLTPYAEIDMKTSGGMDSYNALQISVTKRANNGLTLNSQYTLGKSYGTSAGSNEGITASNNAQALSEYDFDKGSNSFDVRHNFNTSAVYLIPVGAGPGKKDLGSAGNAIGAASHLDARSGADQRTHYPLDVVWLDAAGAVFQTALQLAPELQQSLTRPEAETAAERGVRT
jgi:hypothetical protein